MVYKHLDGQGVNILRSDTEDEASLLQVLDTILPRGRQSLPTRTADIEYLGKTVDVQDKTACTLSFAVYPKAVLW